MLSGPDSVTIDHWGQRNSQPSCNKAAFIRTRPTLKLIHIRLKISRLIKKRSSSQTEY